MDLHGEAYHKLTASVTEILRSELSNPSAQAAIQKVIGTEGTVKVEGANYLREAVITGINGFTSLRILK